MTAMTSLPRPAAVRPLYAGGPTVSALAWGMWRFCGTDVAAAEARVNAALEAGVTLFDTADIYGPDNGEAFGAAEALLGAVLRRAPHLREKMVLASKGGIVIGVPYDTSGTYVAKAIDASLARLGLETMALWQIHRPDILTHPEEIARAVEDAHAAGKIGAFGVSNYAPAQVQALAAYLSLPIVSTQIEYSPLAIAPLSDGTLDQALERRMAVLAWSPLGGGRLGNPKDSKGEAVAAALDRKAAACGVSRAAAAYSWVMAHPAAPIPIVGTQTLERIAEIPSAFTPTWTRSEWYEVLTAARGEPLP